MKKIAILISALTLNAQAASLDAAQKKEIEAVVAQYLKDHPEVIIEAIQIWQEKRAAEEAKQKADAIAALHKEAQNTDSPVWGNPKGKTTIIEFFDYNCPYCKRVFPSLRQLIEEDGDIRVVMKEFPVLGENSEYAARAALAAHKQGKYDAFHAAMMEKGSRLNPSGVDWVAEKVGIDVQQMKKDMHSPEVDRELAEVRSWAHMLGVNGTPAFVIGDQLIPGAISADKMKKLIEQVRR